MFGTVRHMVRSAAPNALSISIRGWIMRTWFSMLVAGCLAAVTVLAQGPEVVDIRLTQPPPNQLRIADLWKVELNNRSGRAVRVILHGTAEETSIPDGLIVEATTRILTLAPGRTMVTGSDVQPIKTENENARYRDALLQTGSVPTGDYTICCEVISAESELVLGRDCKFVTVNRMSQPILISPPDESAVSDRLPVFTWMGSTPPGPGQRILYRINIAEIFGAQTPFDAIQRNPSFLMMENLTATVFQYPVSARQFEKGRRYAWMITAYERTPKAQYPLGVSEVWSFTYGPDDVADGGGRDTTGGEGGKGDRRDDAGGAGGDTKITDVCPGENWDFEIGSLACWTPEGDAWTDQPSRGQHPVMGDVGQQRDWWLTSSTTALGEAAKGTLLSEEFQIKNSAIGFLVGGSGSPDAVVELLVERSSRDTFRLTSRKLPGSDREFWVARSTFNAVNDKRAKSTSMSDRLAPIEWDVRPFLNRVAHIVVADRSPVGHVNADHFRFYDLELLDTIKQPVLVMAAGERHSLAVTPEPKTTKDLHAKLNSDIVKLAGGSLQNDLETIVNETSVTTKGRVRTFAATSDAMESFVASPSQDPPPTDDKIAMTMSPASEAKIAAFAASKLPPNNIIWGWGSNASKQVARAYGALVSEPQTIKDVKNIDAIAGGMGHTLAAGRDNKLYVWGENDYYQLGLGASKRNVQSDPGSYPTLKVVKVAAGQRHSLVLGANGYVYFAGYNQNGEAGLGVTRIEYPTTKQTAAILHLPVLFPVIGLQNIVDIAAGANHNVALGSNGAIYAWGVNMYGQVGQDPDSVQVDRPVAIALGAPTTTRKGLRNLAAAVAAGDYHTMALTMDGTVYTWGGNASGQLGDGTTTDRFQPKRVEGLQNIRAIAAGSTFSMALDTAGRVWAWGNNVLGQLGTGDRLSSWKPVQVARVDAIRGIVAGGAHAMAVRADGSLWTWGTNTYGQLGEGSVIDLTPVPLDPPLGPMRVEKLAMP